MPVSLFRRAAAAVLLGSAAFAAPPTQAAAPLPVDLELILAIDVSGSVDAVEARLQREGYIAALTSDKVMKAIQSGAYRRIALAYVEWAGAQHQQTIVDWTLVEKPEDARAFVAQVADSPYGAYRWTSISTAIDYSMTVFAKSPFEGTRRVIDISGDGKNNHGRDLSAARDEAVKAGVTINGLPILSDRAGGTAAGDYGYGARGWPSDPDLDRYYQEFVIGGPGAFMVPAKSFDTFAEAVMSKLIREIAGLPPGAPLDGDTQLAVAPAPGAYSTKASSSSTGSP